VSRSGRERPWRAGGCKQLQTKHSAERAREIGGLVDNLGNIVDASGAFAWTYGGCQRCQFIVRVAFMPHWEANLRPRRYQVSGPKPYAKHSIIESASPSCPLVVQTIPLLLFALQSSPLHSNKSHPFPRPSSKRKPQRAYRPTVVLVCMPCKLSSTWSYSPAMSSAACSSEITLGI
jgi:hypothetical protein